MFDRMPLEAQGKLPKIPNVKRSPLSISEKDMIRSQFIPCWSMPAGAKDAGSLAVRVKVELQQDGTVTKVMVDNGQAVEYGQPLFIIE